MGVDDIVMSNVQKRAKKSNNSISVLSSICMCHWLYPIIQRNGEKTPVIDCHINIGIHVGYILLPKLGADGSVAGRQVLLTESYLFWTDPQDTEEKRRPTPGWVGSKGCKRGKDLHPTSSEGPFVGRFWSLFAHTYMCKT